MSPAPRIIAVKPPHKRTGAAAREWPWSFDYLNEDGEWRTFAFQTKRACFEEYNRNTLKGLLTRSVEEAA